jgi:hypothetical protein
MDKILKIHFKTKKNVKKEVMKTIDQEHCKGKIKHRRKCKVYDLKKSKIGNSKRESLIPSMASSRYVRNLFVTVF